MGKTNHHANQTTEKEMIYEPGTMECRILIDAKDKLMDMQINLATLEGTGEIVQQLKEIYQDLDYMHETIRKETPYAWTNDAF